MVGVEMVAAAEWKVAKLEARGAVAALVLGTAVVELASAATAELAAVWNILCIPRSLPTNICSSTPASGLHTTTGRHRSVGASLRA